MGIIEAATKLRARIDAADAARTVLADAIIAPQIRSGELSDTEIAARSAVFPAWAAGVDVKAGAGDVLAWDGTLVEVVQAHTTQADWTPDRVPALFRIYRTPQMTAWVAGIAVKAGERFTFGGATWEVVQAHTTQKGWEPDRVPSLWRKV